MTNRSAELRTVLPVLGNLSNEELQEVANYVARIVLDRKNERQKELWGNVMAAIQKYEAEVEEITFTCSGINYNCWCSDEPGVIEAIN